MQTILVLKLLLSLVSISNCILWELTNVDFSRTGRTSAVAVSDLDNDGTLEVIVSVLDGPNKILKYDSTTKEYYDVATLHPQYNITRDERGRTTTVCTCDMDGDGKEEIYLHNHNDVYFADSRLDVVPDKLFKIVDGKYVDLFSISENERSLAPRYGGHAVACIDRTGSGLYDVIVATLTKGGKGAYRVFSAQTDNKTSSKIRLAEISEEIGLDIERDGRGILVGSLFSDNHHSDVFITNDNSYHVGSRVMRHNGRNVLLKNNGDGTFEDVATKLGVDDINGNGRGSGLGDFNADGRMDITFTNWLGPTRVFQQYVEKSEIHFREVGGSSFTKPSATNVLLTGDFDNDGQVEVLKAGANGDNTFPKYNSIFRISTPTNSTDAEFNKAAVDANAKFKNLKIRGIAVADVNNDGILELFISHDKYHHQTFSIFQNEINTYNWIRFIPLTKHGSFARGSTVILTAGSREERHVIGGDCSFMCQSEPIAHFGLGNNIAKQVEIIWPDGHTIRKVLYKHENRKTLVIAYSGSVTYMAFRTHTDNDLSVGSVLKSHICGIVTSFITAFWILSRCI